MQIRTFAVGPLQTNCYLVEDEGELIVIDPGDDLDHILDGLEHRIPREIVLTHRHWDHIGALSGLVQETGAPTAAHELDVEAICDSTGVGNGSASAAARGFMSQPYGASGIDRPLREGDVVSVGHSELQVIHTPGHTIGSMCLYCPREKVLFAGDTLFSGGSYGRTDMESGSFDDIVASMARLAKLPDDTVILPGHGPRSTMGRERIQNTYLRV